MLDPAPGVTVTCDDSLLEHDAVAGEGSWTFE
jgi:hypothetical protein